MEPVTLTPIGVIHSCFKERFGIPRQANLVPEAEAVLEILPPYGDDHAFRGLEDFSHIWLIYLFHGHIRGGWRPTVRPPRLGGQQRIGVFASRSPHRPNRLGLSVVTLKAIRREQGRLRIHLGGVDLLDGTPVLDVKPYLSYADRVEGARSGYADHPPKARKRVVFSDLAAGQCAEREDAGLVGLKALIEGVVSLDPRPAFQVSSEKKTEFALKLYDFDLKWRVEGGVITILGLFPA